MSVELTPQQARVLAIVQQGASNKQIAKHLNVTEATVKLHIGKLLKKYCAHNRFQLALFTRTNPNSPLALPLLQAKPVGWVKRTKNDVRGVVFTSRPPDETWEAIYVKKD
jgi:DNA-binding CsgD family transcriptional regulator